MKALTAFIVLAACIVIDLTCASSGQYVSHASHPETSEFCNKAESFCRNCKAIVHCIPKLGGGFIEANESCSLHHTCDDDNVTSCVPTQGECGCEGVFAGSKADPYDPHWYIICFDEIPTYEECPSNQFYDPDKEKCVTSTFHCSSAGFYPSPTSCTEFYLCIEDDNGKLHAMQDECPSGTFFDEDSPENYCQPLPTPFACTEVGKFSDPYECRAYHQCLVDYGPGTDYCCNSNYVFSEATGHCEYDPYCTDSSDCKITLSGGPLCT